MGGGDEREEAERVVAEWGLVGGARFGDCLSEGRELVRGQGARRPPPWPRLPHLLGLHLIFPGAAAASDAAAFGVEGRVRRHLLLDRGFLQNFENTWQRTIRSCPTLAKFERSANRINNQTLLVSYLIREGTREWSRAPERRVFPRLCALAGRGPRGEEEGI